MFRKFVILITAVFGLYMLFLAAVGLFADGATIIEQAQLVVINPIATFVLLLGLFNEWLLMQIAPLFVITAVVAILGNLILTATTFAHYASTEALPILLLTLPFTLFLFYYTRQKVRLKQFSG